MVVLWVFFVGHKFCLCRSIAERREKNKVGPKKCVCALELIARLGLAIGNPFGKMG
jgi:hypothetical protein